MGGLRDDAHYCLPRVQERAGPGLPYLPPPPSYARARRRWCRSDIRRRHYLSTSLVCKSETEVVWLRLSTPVAPKSPCPSPMSETSNPFTKLTRFAVDPEPGTPPPRTCAATPTQCPDMLAAHTQDDDRPRRVSRQASSGPFTIHITLSIAVA
ncbi:hypothetical protein BDZ97DRAFT_370841 [Flammula alnicola]|nr:hypothetical protein BDZ97DRAFT_370841 [Flammula alnicola]